jgi:hypothetical protein
VAIGFYGRLKSRPKGKKRKKAKEKKREKLVDGSGHSMN